MTSLQRAWRGGKNDWRLHVLSIFSVAVAFVCLAAALLVVVNVDGLRDRWARAGRASIYFKIETTEAQVRAIENAVRAAEGVTDVRYVSSDEARREVLGRGDQVLAALPAAAFPASLEVMVDEGTEGGKLATLASRVSALPQVESVETYQDWTERLASVLTSGVTASLVLAFVVLGAVVSVVASTIRLALQRRRIEVEVLKLVGATDSYVRRPFVVEGAAQGGIGALLALILLAVLYGIVRENLGGELGVLVGMQPVFLPWTFMISMVALGSLLGAVAAWGSLRRLLVV
ncbi:MAG: permease-like cell division protein FtsX [Polyangiaceae bacterium]|nr:permease-like cell division protein FtsX [Polyangiaceae bacterium]MCW5792028.1 permease-like cell division protein FtsX [Polyangiaceae bacterium]